MIFLLVPLLTWALFSPTLWTVARDTNQQGGKMYNYKNVTVDMIKRAQAGSKKARDAACMGTYKLICQIAARVARAYGQDPEDLIQAGVLGCLEGIDKFDPDRGIKPTTFLTWHIRRRIFELARKQSTPVKGPSTDGASKVHYNGRKVRARIMAEKGQCDDLDVARELDVPVSDVRAVGLASQPVASLDARQGVEQGTLGDTLADPRPGPDETVEAAQNAAWVREGLKVFREGLNETEKAVFDLRIDSANPLPGRLVGDMLDMSRQAVSLYEIKIRAKLQKRMKAILK